MSTFLRRLRRVATTGFGGFVGVKGNPAAGYDADLAAQAAASSPRVQHMAGSDAALHPPTGTSCASCGRPFRDTDPVRVLGKGTVHDVCPF